MSAHKHLNVGSGNTIDFSYVSRHDNYNLAGAGLQMRSSDCLVGASVVTKQFSRMLVPRCTLEK